jgi:hypothetical protein
MVLKTENPFKIYVSRYSTSKPSQSPCLAQTMSNKHQFPPLYPDDMPKYAKPAGEALCASDVKNYPGQNQGQFCWSVFSHNTTRCHLKSHSRKFFSIGKNIMNMFIV